MKREYRRFYSDLETVVYPGQTKTAAWSAAVVGEESDEVIIHHSIPQMWEWLKKQKGNLLIYYHNLKFDGFFWVDFFLRNKILTQSLHKYANGDYFFKRPHKMYNKEFVYSINKLGQWYSISIKQNNRLIIFRDSLKLLPFPLKSIGQAFNTKHQKLEMEYEGLRYPGCKINEDEKKYIENDVYVLKEGMQEMIKRGFDKLTIGSCCMEDFKTRFNRNNETKDYEKFFPNLYEIPLDKKFFSKDPVYGYTIGEYVLKSYKGAWCYCDPEKQGEIIENGLTLDVTSLYASVMHSQSGNKYPVGIPKMLKGSIPDMYFTKDGKIKTPENQYCFVRFNCSFNVKENHFPFIQIKDNWLYPVHEHLKTSDVYDRKKGTFYKYRTLEDGSIVPITVTLTMCEDEFNLFLEHYDVSNLTFLDGCIFSAKIGIFDDYINYWFGEKCNAKTKVERSISKLMLTNLYGKFATTPDSSFKYLLMGEDNILHYKTQKSYDKKPGYIPIGSTITAKARCFIIRAAQANYNYFCYCDTDSLHLKCKIEEVRGLIIAENKLCTFKLENEWEKAIFVRQKTYAEQVRVSDKEVDLQITCAGMPNHCKDLLRFSITRQLKDLKPLAKKVGNHYVISDPIEHKFLCKKRTLEDFKGGLVVPSKLYSKTIEGGTILYKDDYKLKELDKFYQID